MTRLGTSKQAARSKGIVRQQIRQQMKGAFPYCKWCGGNGCMCCDEERRKYEERMSQPIFTADVNDPDDMAALRRVVGREALERAFSPGGGGVGEIEFNAAVESVLQALRKARSKGDSPVQEEATDMAQRGGTTSPTLAHVAKEAER
jgi:hypothetical protein